MRKILVSMFAIALVVVLAIPTMAAVDVDNNKTTTVAAGITIDSWNNKGTKEVTVTISEDAVKGSLTVFYGNDKPQKSAAFDTTEPTVWNVDVPNGGVSYTWVPAPCECGFCVWNDYIVDWLDVAKDLSAKFEIAGIPGNGGNVALIATIPAVEALACGVTFDEVNEAVEPLKAAYWVALEAYNLVFAAVDLNIWIHYASDRIELLKEAGLWDTDPCQVLYFYMVDSYHYVYLPAYNWGTGTTAEVNAAIDNVKAAYWATF